MKKRLLIVILSASLLMTGCTTFRSAIKDVSAEFIGLEREFHVYDDAGIETMMVTGKNTDMQASDVENMLLIEVDGSRWQHVGSTLIAYEKNLINHIEKYQDTMVLSGDNQGTITAIDGAMNEFISKLTGLKRVVIVKTQRGVPIAVFEGDNVLVEASSLPDTTKILIDGMRLHVYRADLEIIEKSLF